ncbi:hypothetical protein TIFTF001_038807 [Ficus carica]|uniref:O-methyltransferase C-terminal domain-containing protein n=1 Tax=Ficus carica TaxID=3494 RepID=A0AA88E7X4_FICCA|nr:hypothetical protein TIFTF001_038807 [Ficus carica]
MKFRISFDAINVFMVKFVSFFPLNGKVIAVEAVLPVKPGTSYVMKKAFQGDVLLMTQNPGGKERTQQDFQLLATGSGFSGVRFECCVCYKLVGYGVL